MIFHKVHDKSIDHKDLELKVCNKIIKRVYSFKYLGIRLDPNLNFMSQYDYVLSKTASKLSYLYGIKRYLSANIMKVMFNAYIHSIADYCIEVWAIQSDNYLQKIQDKIDRFLINYFLPVISKKLNKRNCKQKLKFRSKLSNLDINQIRQDCNFYTIHERRDIVCLFVCLLISKLPT